MEDDQQQEDHENERIFVVLNKSKTSNLKQLDKNKLHINKDSKITELQKYIRGKLTLTSGETIFLFAHNSILHVNDTLGEIYNRFKNQLQNNRLLIYYTEHSAF